MTPEEFKRRVKALGTQADFAETIGYSREHISQMARGAVDIPKHIPYTLAGVELAAQKEQTMNIITTDHIDAHFTRWGNSATTIEGFVTYAWDEREETLEDLQAEGMGNLVSNVIYTLEQDERHEELDVSEEVVREWLESNREELIEAIVGSMDEEE